jgi:hypothetical protein
MVHLLINKNNEIVNYSIGQFQHDSPVVVNLDLSKNETKFMKSLFRSYYTKNRTPDVPLNYFNSKLKSYQRKLKIDGLYGYN